MGYSYRAIITYVDSHDTREVLISNPSETVSNVDDPVEGEVVLVGEPLEGGTMSVRTSGVLRRRYRQPFRFMGIFQGWPQLAFR